MQNPPHVSSSQSSTCQYWLSAQQKVLRWRQATTSQCCVLEKCSIPRVHSTRLACQGTSHSRGWAWPHFSLCASQSSSCLPSRFEGFHGAELSSHHWSQRRVRSSSLWSVHSTTWIVRISNRLFLFHYDRSGSWQRIFQIRSLFLVQISTVDSSRVFCDHQNLIPFSQARGAQPSSQHDLSNPSFDWP